MIESIWYGDSVWRWPLWPIGAAFRAVATARAAAYRAGLRRSIALPAPVVVVGNVTVGGTGKTPLVIWLAAQLGGRGYAVGIVTRGYGGAAAHWPQWVHGASDAHQVGDEAVLLARRTGCPVVAAPDRVAAARALLERRAVDVLLSDDGLQHYRLRRAFEIGVVDGARGLGNGLCLPAGPLREPASRLARVDAVVVNEGPAEYVPPGLEGSKVCRARLVVKRVYRVSDGASGSLADFAGRRVLAVAGIGHPERFFRLLERAGLVVVRRPLADHAVLEPRHFEREADIPVLITEKDAVKCRPGDPDIWVVAVDLEVDAVGGASLVAALVERIGPPRRSEA